MSTYAARLAALSPADSLAATTVTHRAIWLSGQSSYAHSHLNPEQRETLAPLRELGYELVDAGFPYHPAYLTAPWGREPLVAASLRNGRQTLATYLSPRHQGVLARHLQPVVGHTTDRLVVVAASSGLRMWLSALPGLVLPPNLRVLVVALGPAVVRDPRSGRSGQWAGHQERLDLHVAVGRPDGISRRTYAGHVDTWVAASHMEYASDPEVRALVSRLGAKHAP